MNFEKKNAGWADNKSIGCIMSYYSKNFSETFFSEKTAVLPPLNKTQKEQLVILFNRLLEQAMPAKYISKADPETIWYRHILDSLIPFSDIEIMNLICKNSNNVEKPVQRKIYDLGTGAGLPLLPVAILGDEYNQYIGVDNSLKRLAFIESTAEELGLSSVKVIHEETSKARYHDADLIMFRAFRRPLAAFELSSGYARDNTKLLYYRSKPVMLDNHCLGDNTSEDSLNKRVYDLGLKMLKFKTYENIKILGNRGFYLLEKAYKTNKSYPRSFKKIQKDRLVQEVI